MYSLTFRRRAQQDFDYDASVGVRIGIHNYYDVSLVSLEDTSQCTVHSAQSIYQPDECGAIKIEKEALERAGR